MGKTFFKIKFTNVLLFRKISLHLYQSITRYFENVKDLQTQFSLVSS